MLRLATECLTNKIWSKNGSGPVPEPKSAYLTVALMKRAAEIEDKKFVALAKRIEQTQSRVDCTV
jgi:hypothetical protein